MQNLIPGKRYKVKHINGNWSGSVLFIKDRGKLENRRFEVEDIKVEVGGRGVIDYFAKMGFKTVFGNIDWSWKLDEPLNLENV